MNRCTYTLIVIIILVIICYTIFYIGHLRRFAMEEQQKKSRPSLKRTQVGTSLDKDLYATLKQFSQDSRIPQSKLFDEALELLFNKYNIRIINHTES